MVNIPKEVMDVLSASDSAKMIATIDAKGIPNVVPIWFVAVDPETIAFAEVFIIKTKKTLKRTSKLLLQCSKDQ